MCGDGRESRLDGVTQADKGKNETRHGETRYEKKKKDLQGLECSYRTRPQGGIRKIT